jgi:hypothetical protein
LVPISCALAFKIQVNVKVLVSVVVRDKQRLAVGDLKKEDFQVFDQGLPQSISGFSVEKRGLAEIGTGVVAHHQPLPTKSVRF